eukprot:12790460-Prorocentrum_lima.AAC.1
MAAALRLFCVQLRWSIWRDSKRARCAGFAAKPRAKFSALQRRKAQVACYGVSYMLQLHFRMESLIREFSEIGVNGITWLELCRPTTKDRFQHMNVVFGASTHHQDE